MPVNPILLRFIRSELRPRKAVFWYLLTLIITGFTVATIYVPQIVRDTDAQLAARSAFVPVLIIQGIILLFLGTGSVASGITREKVDQVLDYQRLTPLPIRAKILGYLFGLPIREYVLFAITLPFLAFVLIVGRIPPAAFLPYFAVFFSSAILYHLTGMVAGMLSSRWRWSARISQALILLLYFILPQLSHFGLVFLEFLTVRPVFAERILPLAGIASDSETAPIGLFAGQRVPLFAFSLSSTVFSLLIQILLIALLLRILTRKWIADTVPAISKTLALITFASFCFLSYANLWPTLTRASEALPFFQRDAALSAELAWFALPTLLAVLTTFLGFFLFASAVPDPNRLHQGKLLFPSPPNAPHPSTDLPAPPNSPHPNTGQPTIRKLRPFLHSTLHDLTPSGFFLLSFAALQLTFLGLLFLTLSFHYSLPEPGARPALAIPLLFLATFLNLAHFRAFKEAFGPSRMALFLLLAWLLPVLFATFLLAVNTDYAHAAFLVSALSPIALPVFSMAFLLPPESFTDYTAAHAQATILGFALLITLNLALLYKLHQPSPRP